jgi:hypothetical protein
MQALGEKSLYVACSYFLFQRTSEVRGIRTVGESATIRMEIVMGLKNFRVESNFYKTCANMNDFYCIIIMIVTRNLFCFIALAGNFRSRKVKFVVIGCIIFVLVFLRMLGVCKKK